MKVTREASSVTVEFEPGTDNSLFDHFAVFMDALKIVSDRNEERGEVWRQSGLKGQVFNVHAKAERAFRQLFQGGVIPSSDHLLDLINYAAFACRMINMAEETSIDQDRIKNGNWPW